MMKNGDLFKEELNWPWMFYSKEERERERERELGLVEGESVSEEER